MCPAVTRSVMVSITKILAITPFLINIYLLFILLSTFFLQSLNRSSEPGLSSVTVRSAVVGCDFSCGWGAAQPPPSLALQSQICNQFLNPPENPSSNTEIFPPPCKLLLPALQAVEAKCYSQDSLDFDFTFS